VGVNKSLKSAALRRKVPPMLLMFDDQRTFWTLLGMGLAVLMLYGPVVGRRDHNALRYLLGPWLCPAVVAAYYYFKPFTPYSVGAARIADMVDDHTRDPDARRLVEVFQSKEARHFLVRATLKLSSRLFGIMMFLALLHWQSLTWTLTSSWLGGGLIGGWIGSFIVLMVEISHWGLERWEADSRGE
jgi:hypothetical protein